jgi:Fic family protein
MAELLLDRVLREIRERLAASRDAYEESKRLEAALVALGETSRSSGSVRRERNRGRGSRGTSTSARAPRGENLQRIRNAVAERPGASAGEIASATGINRATVASTLSKLVREGELGRADLPSGRVGYRSRSTAEPNAMTEAE